MASHAKWCVFTLVWFYLTVTLEMATVSEISITRFRSTGWYAQSVSQGIPRLKDDYHNVRTIASSSYDGRVMMSQAQTALSMSNHVQSGSFGGISQTATFYDTTILVSAGSPTMKSGSFKPTPTSTGMFEVPIEDHNKSRMTSDNPMANQSMSTVDWNFFPIPAAEEDPPAGRPRDLTRYQKSYSFSRTQPVRVRIIRR